MPHSAIPYCTRGLNALVGGCEPCSPGCTACWARAGHDMRHKAYKDQERLFGPGQARLPRQYAKPFSELQWFPERLEEPLRTRKPQTWAVCFQADLFHPSVPDRYIREVFCTMNFAFTHTFLILTKRPERMAALIPELPYMCENQEEDSLAIINRWGHWPLKNVYCGLTVCNQAEADALPDLPPGWNLWLSLEPLLGPIEKPREWWQRFRVVIPGGESGAKARPCDVAWIRSIVRQAEAAGTKVFVKQLGARPLTADPVLAHPAMKHAENALRKRYWLQNYGALPMAIRDRAGADPAEFPEDLRVRELPWTR